MTSPFASIPAAVLLMAPVFLVGAAVLLLDPNDYKPQMIEAVQNATGRTLTLRGPLRLSRSLWPTISLMVRNPMFR